MTNSFRNSNNCDHLHDRQNPWLELFLKSFDPTKTDISINFLTDVKASLY